MKLQKSSRDLRLLASLCALTIAVMISVHQKHYILDLSHPQTFYRMSRHKCGDLVLLTFAWLLLELRHWFTPQSSPIPMQEAASGQV